MLNNCPQLCSSPKHFQSNITWKILTEYLWEFHSKIVLTAVYTMHNSRSSQATLKQLVMWYQLGFIIECFLLSKYCINLPTSVNQANISSEWPEWTSWSSLMSCSLLFEKDGWMAHAVMYRLTVTQLWQRGWILVFFFWEISLTSLFLQSMAILALWVRPLIILSFIASNKPQSPAKNKVSLSCLLPRGTGMV